MFKYKKIIVSILIAVLAISFAGCSNNYFVNSRINDALAQGSKSEEAIDWLIYNKDLVAPVLTDRLSAGSKGKVEETKELLNIMGKDGITIVLSDFHSLSESGKTALAEVLVSQGTKDAIMQLLAMSSLEGGFDISVSALITMGDTAYSFLETLLYQDEYYDCVNAVLAGNSQNVIADIIPLMNNQNSYIQNRALEIFALSGSDIIAPLVKQVLSDSSLTNEKAIRISSIALKNNKDTAIDEIINTVALGNSDPAASSTMLYELAKEDDLGIIFEKCATSTNAMNTNDMLKELVNQAGVPRIIQTALNSESNETVTSISFALASYEHSTETFVEILNSVEADDYTNSNIYILAGKLIYDPILSGIAQAIISQDAIALNASLQMDGANPKKIGEAISQTSENQTIVDRFNAILNNMNSLDARSTMIILAYGEEETYPKLVWDRYISTDSALSQIAMDVILEATSMGIKFKYTDMNFFPYADKLLTDLNSSNSETKNKAIQILNKIPEGVEHHEFYMHIYSGYKDQSVFTILCWHFVGEGAQKLNLQIEGTDTAVSEINYDIKSIKVSKIDADDFIDYEGMIKQSLNTLGLKISNTANVKLEITISETPLYKKYSGLVGNSYAGAKCTTTLDVYIGGDKVKSVSGFYEILPPADKPVDDNTYEYKTEPEDAPLETPFINSYVEALYNTFGENVLYGTYQFDRLATLEAGKEIWGIN